MIRSRPARLCALSVLACLAALPAQAVSVVDLPAAFSDPTVASDLAFNDLCSADGGGTFGCETALFQLRGGDGAGGGAAQKELKTIRIDESDPTSFVQRTNQERDFVHGNGVKRRFTMTFTPDAVDPDMSDFVLDYDGTTLSGQESLNGFKTLILRVRAGTRGGLAMTDMEINGVAIPDMIVPMVDPDTGSDSRAYLAVTGFDATQPLTFVGDATFTFQGSKTPSSAVIFEAKFTDLEFAAVPVPASALLLAGALGGLGALRRRRR